MADQPTRKPLALIQFSTSVNLVGYDFPLVQWVQRRGVEQAWLDGETVVIGGDRFPLHGGLIAHYRLARAALAPVKSSEVPASP